MREYRATERLRVVIADIARLPVDVIVNAANESLLGGGGVDGAIHDAAGPELLVACKAIGRCPTGQVRITPGFELPARWIIHAVGPVWRGGGSSEHELLRECYSAALGLAAEVGAETMALPCISAGAYAFPLDESCDIATNTVLKWQANNKLPYEITFCCWLGHEFEEYEAKLAAMNF
jgi:O-acetyl-ADP-ribose deacetylase (regulator of RNase III)